MCTQQSDSSLVESSSRLGKTITIHHMERCRCMSSDDRRKKYRESLAIGIHRGISRPFIRGPMVFLLQKNLYTSKRKSYARASSVLLFFFAENPSNCHLLFVRVGGYGKMYHAQVRDPRTKELRSCYHAGIYSCLSSLTFRPSGGLLFLLLLPVTVPRPRNTTVYPRPLAPRPPPLRESRWHEGPRTFLFCRCRWIRPYGRVEPLDSALKASPTTQQQLLQ